MDLNLNIGTYKNKSSYFDFYKMEYKEVEFSIEQQEGEADTAGKDYIMFQWLDSSNNPPEV